MITGRPGKSTFLKSINVGLAAARMERLARWWRMLLRAKSHRRETGGYFCEINQASIKKVGRSVRLTA
ncbi:hypothetical protein bcgnr5380_57970 [Bacillus cereus]